MAKNEITLGQKLRALQAGIRPAFASEDADAVEALRAKIVGFAKLASDLRAEFDKCVDFRDEGMFGENFAPTVTRIRAKGENVGRPAKEKVDALAELDI